MLRESIVGTPIGRLATALRDAVELLRTPREALGTTVNDQLAIRLIVRLCRPEHVFLDVGAHIGSVIAEVRHQCPGAKIVAFEAIPQKVERLRRKFSDVTIHSCALSDHDGEVTFYIDTEQSGYSSLAERPTSHAILVPQRRLDDLVTRADLIKIDVEGAELGVLRGADRLVRESQPIILFESGPGDVLGYTKESMFEWFAERNYGIFAPNRLDGTGGAMTLDGFLDSHEYPRRTTNYIAMPLSRVSEIRAHFGR